MASTDKPDNTKPRHLTGRPSARHSASAVLLASSLLYVPSSSAALHIGRFAELFGAFALPALSGTLVAALAALVFASPRHKRDGIEAPSRPTARLSLRLLGAAAFVGGLMGILACALAPSASTAALTACSLAYGAGCTAAFIAWGEMYASLLPKQALTNIIASCVLLVPLLWALFSLEDIPATVLLVTCSFAAALIPLVPPRRSAQTVVNHKVRAATPDIPVADGDANLDRRPHVLVKYLQVLGRPALCAAVFGFTSYALDAPVWHSVEHAPELLGLLLAAFCLTPLLVSRFDHPVFPYAYQVVLPALSLLLLMARLLSSEGWVPSVAFGTLYSCIVGVTFMLVFAASSAMGAAGDLPMETTVSLGIVCYALPCLLGRALLTLTGSVDFFTLPSLLLWIACFGYLAFSPAIQAWMHANRDADDGSGPMGDDIARRVDELAETYRLSPRERDVLYFLAHGCSSAYISQTLFISDSTVRTHTRNIHRKLGISSKDELFELITRQKEMGV